MFPLRVPLYLYVWDAVNRSCDVAATRDQCVNLGAAAPLSSNDREGEGLLDDDAPLSTVREWRVVYGWRERIRRCMLLCVFKCAFFCVCVVFLCLCTNQLNVCVCVRVIPNIHMWTAVGLLWASAISFQSHPSMWLICCGAGAPRGNVIIPCWPQSTGFTALSFSGGTAARGPFSLAISNSMSLKPHYISEICIKSSLPSPPLISF